MQPTRVRSIRLRGIVEKTPSPGAAMSTKSGSRFENAGTEPSSRSAATPITCGSADGQSAKFHGFVAMSPLPTADTTTTPFEYA